MAHGQGGRRGGDHRVRGGHDRLAGRKRHAVDVDLQPAGLAGEHITEVQVDRERAIIADGKVIGDQRVQRCSAGRNIKQTKDQIDRLADRLAAWQRETAGRIEVTIAAHPKDGAPWQEPEDALVVVDKTDHVFVVTAAPLTTA
jgi:hypothetical protein